MNNDLKEILWIIKSCAMDYDKQEEGMHTFEWSELWVLNKYIKKLQAKVNQLETSIATKDNELLQLKEELRQLKINRDEAIKHIKDKTKVIPFTKEGEGGGLELSDYDLADLLSLLERGKE